MLELCSSCLALAYQQAMGLRKGDHDNRIQFDLFPDSCNPVTIKKEIKFYLYGEKRVIKMKTNSIPSMEHEDIPFHKQKVVRVCLPSHHQRCRILPSHISLRQRNRGMAQH